MSDKYSIYNDSALMKNGEIIKFMDGAREMIETIEGNGLRILELETTVKSLNLSTETINEDNEIKDKEIADLEKIKENREIAYNIVYARMKELEMTNEHLEGLSANYLSKYLKEQAENKALREGIERISLFSSNITSRYIREQLKHLLSSPVDKSTVSVSKVDSKPTTINQKE